MLSVKHVEPSGDESLFLANQTAFYRRGELTGRADGPPDEKHPVVIAYGVPGPDEGARKDGVVHIGDGTVYVMNDSGKTIAVYDL